MTDKRYVLTEELRDEILLGLKSNNANGKVWMRNIEDALTTLPTVQPQGVVSRLEIMRALESARTSGGHTLTVMADAIQNLLTLGHSEESK